MWVLVWQLEHVETLGLDPNRQRRRFPLAVYLASHGRSRELLDSERLLGDDLQNMHGRWCESEDEGEGESGKCHVLLRGTPFYKRCTLYQALVQPRPSLKSAMQNASNYL
jgi:hypothetical protein